MIYEEELKFLLSFRLGVGGGDKLGWGVVGRGQAFSPGTTSLIVNCILISEQIQFNVSR